MSIKAAMNVQTQHHQGLPLADSSDLLRCCTFLAELTGSEELIGAMQDIAARNPLGSKQLILEKISEGAATVGFKTHICRPKEEGWRGIGQQLPGIVENRQGRFLVVTDIEPAQAGVPIRVKFWIPGRDSSEPLMTASFEEFQQLWTGGILQFQKVNTCLVCLSIIAKEHKLEVSQERLIHDYGIGQEEIPPRKMLRMSKEIGLKARLVSLDWFELRKLGGLYPVIAQLKNGRHVIVVGATGNGSGEEKMAVACYDPLLQDGHVHLKRQQFEELWSGQIYIFKRQYGLRDESQPFSLRWFIPEILKQKTSFIDIAIAVLFINLIALITPIFFQIVIDKVLVNQAFTTLHVLGAGMAAMLLVNGLLDFLRDYLLLHSTNKIDVRVTGRTFHHMLLLPLGFFEKITAGVLTKHMQQTASIRGFLTGSVFLTLLEATSLFIFLPFLFFYSSHLTSVVLIFTLSICGIILILMPPFKRRLNELYNAEGERQAMLVETISGMPTVKAMAIEPHLLNQWEEKVARAVSMQFRVGKISITAKSLTQFFERLMIVVLIWVGASQVFNGSLTVGALIAFQMLASRVTAPLVRLVGLIHQYQEAALSVEKLGLVMNAKREWGAERHGTRSSLKGDIEFDNVSFRYAPDLPYALQEISLSITGGRTMGIVGPSGSGKTTLTRLLQKAYFPSAGTVRISGCFLNEIDTAYLRQNTGVVLQESFLFRATVADNIRAGQAGVTRKQIIDAAILAGADEFIVRLPKGYDTMLVEGATNLSGGQRQRLAIARALLTDPDILIFDEATSSLDPESERVVRENLAGMSNGRTVLVVSHRLSMLKNVDSIIVLNKGRVIAQGAHQELMDTCSLYHGLWVQQMEI